MNCLAKGGGTKKRFQYYFNPNSSRHFLYYRAIQGHSGDNAIDPALQDNVLLPKGFTEYIYPVGNANELNSMTRIRFVPRGTSLKKGRQAVFLTAVDPMEDVHGMGETPCDLTKPRIAPYKNTWKRVNSRRKRLKSGRQAVFFSTVNPMEDGNGVGETPRDLTKPRIAPYKNTWRPHQNTVYWCNLKLAQEKYLQFYQPRSHAVVLHTTLPAACIEKAVRMKTQDEPYQKVRLTPRVPRVVLKSNSQYGLQDPQNQDARSSWDPSIDSKSYGETCSNNVDYRISGVPLAAVEQQDTTRENKVFRT